MKLKSTLLAATLLVFTASVATSFAVEEHHDAPATKTDAVKAENGEAKKPVKKVKKHSHMEEKTGMSMSEPVAVEGKAVSKNRHDHTKEKR